MLRKVFHLFYIVVLFGCGVTEVTNPGKTPPKEPEATPEVPETTNELKAQHDFYTDLLENKRSIIIEEFEFFGIPKGQNNLSERDQKLLEAVLAYLSESVRRQCETTTIEEKDFTAIISEVKSEEEAYQVYSQEEKALEELSKKNRQCAEANPRYFEELAEISTNIIRSCFPSNIDLTQYDEQIAKVEIEIQNLIAELRTLDEKLKKSRRYSSSKEDFDKKYQLMRELQDKKSHVRRLKFEKDRAESDQDRRVDPCAVTLIKELDDLIREEQR